MSSASPRVLPRTAMRIVLASFAVVMLASLAGHGDVLGLTPLGNQISSGRRSQVYYESVMLSQDAAVASIKSQTKGTRKALKQAGKALGRARRGYRSKAGVVGVRRSRLDEFEARHKDTPPEEIPEAYVARLRTMRRELGKAVRQRQAAARQLRATQRMRKARASRLGALKRQLRASVARREAAEGGLGAHIVNMTRLAHERAELVSRSQLAMGGSSFSWPAVGRLSQTYGCTGFRLNPPRGSCRHFHDGLDIVAGYGSPVRTAADGVVAFAGWNPWDEGGRAWIMVVSHPDGYVTRYGHLLPGGRARVGQFVRQGQAIGRMGSTGKSTGTHLHFELLRGNSPLNPWGYLPAGMVEPKVTRAPGHKGGKAASRRHKARHGGHAKHAQRRHKQDRRERKKARAAARAKTSPGTDAAMRITVLAPDGLTESASALFESSLDDATTIVCEVLERSGSRDRAVHPADLTLDEDAKREGDSMTVTASDFAEGDPCDSSDDKGPAEGDVQSLGQRGSTALNDVSVGPAVGWAPRGSTPLAS